MRLSGFLTEDQIRAGFASQDRNGNGIVCDKRPPPFEDKFFPVELIVDDLAGVLRSTFKQPFEWLALDEISG